MQKLFLLTKHYSLLSHLVLTIADSLCLRKRYTAIDFGSMSRSRAEGVSNVVAMHIRVCSCSFKVCCTWFQLCY